MLQKLMLNSPQSEEVSEEVAVPGNLRTKTTGLTLGAIALGMVGAIASPAFAHGAQVHYQAIEKSSGPAVQLQAEYDTQEPMQEAQVTVYSPDAPHTPWLTGVTDGAGKFEFSPDQDGEWAVKVRQGGHGAFISVPWPPETALGADNFSGNRSALAVIAQGRGLPQWLGLGLGVAGCLGGAWILMRRSPEPHPSNVANVEMAD